MGSRLLEKYKLLENGDGGSEDSLELSVSVTEHTLSETDSRLRKFARLGHWIFHGLSVILMISAAIVAQHITESSRIACALKHDSWCLCFLSSLRLSKLISLYSSGP